MALFQEEILRVKSWRGTRVSGKVTQVIGLMIESIGPKAELREVCIIYSANRKIPCEVVGFKDNKVLLMTMGEMDRIQPGAEVFPTGHIHRVAVGPALLGRVIDAMGNPIDGKGPIHAEAWYDVSTAPPEALSRERISEPLVTGVRAIDSTCTAGKGQRFGIFSGSGVGKSVLLGMIAKMAYADINVIALIGERGREVREFIERDLGEEGLAKSVVIVVTSDQPALLRSKGASVATSVAEYFRDLGKNVVFMMDSVTRFAMALREIGLAVGEPPTTKGYTPSVFSMLPKLLERAGNNDIGTITGIYTILVEGDDMSDPVADTVRSILDGHIILSRKLASANHFPAIDVLTSLSRVMIDVVDKGHQENAGKLRELLQTYHESEDLINIGAYAKGSNAKIDKAIELNEEIRRFLRQDSKERSTFEMTVKRLEALVG